MGSRCLPEPSRSSKLLALYSLERSLISCAQDRFCWSNSYGADNHEVCMSTTALRNYDFSEVWSRVQITRILEPNSITKWSYNQGYGSSLENVWKIERYNPIQPKLTHRHIQRRCRLSCSGFLQPGGVLELCTHIAMWPSRWILHSPSKWTESEVHTVNKLLFLQVWISKGNCSYKIRWLYCSLISQRLTLICD